VTGPLDPLSDRGVRMVESLAGYEQEDLSVIAIMRAGADELDAIEELMEGVRDQAWPHRADDTFGILALHERQYSLPVAPPGVSLAARQAALKAAVQGRRAGAKRVWVRRMNTAMRGHPWGYEEHTPGPNQLTISIPWAEDSYDSAQVRALAQRITPAHVEIVMRYESGFIVGVATVGDAI
jgi:hypothetical protein